MTSRRTEQEAFWEGAFGDDYIARNRGDRFVASSTHLFARILSECDGVRSIIEFGANVGNNLRALHRLLPEASLTAVEINGNAVTELQKLEYLDEVVHDSMLEFASGRAYDLSLTSGVLIHIDPEELAVAYDRLHGASSCYICVVEYYNPTPIQIPYRGHANMLQKRDFAGEMLDRFADIKLVDYGFVYHRDPLFPLDDCTWFLLKKL